MLGYSKDRKWLLICQNQARDKSTAASTSPKEFIAQLKESKVKSTTIAHVASSLNGEPKAWVQTFLDEGGLAIIISLLNHRVDKETYVPLYFH